VTEKLYTYAQARRIGLRALCELPNEGGHQFQRFYQAKCNGEASINRYICARCDAVITITYPELS
jgi:hypothetical protein